MRTFPLISDLTDVSITSPLTGDALIYDGTKWVSGSAPAPVTRKLTHRDSELLITDGEGNVDSNLSLTFDGTPIMVATADKAVFRQPTSYWIAYVY